MINQTLNDTFTRTLERQIDAIRRWNVVFNSSRDQNEGMHRRLGGARGGSKEQQKRNSGIVTGFVSTTNTTLQEFIHPVERATEVSHLELLVTLPYPYPRHIQTDPTRTSTSWFQKEPPDIVLRAMMHICTMHDDMLRVPRYISEYDDTSGICTHTLLHSDNIEVAKYGFRRSVRTAERLFRFLQRVKVKTQRGETMMMKDISRTRG